MTEKSKEAEQEEKQMMKTKDQAQWGTYKKKGLHVQLESEPNPDSGPAAGWPSCSECVFGPSASA